MKPIVFALLGVLLLALGACAPAGPRTLTVMVHDSFAISEDVLAVFEQEHGVTVKFLSGGDAGAMLNQAALARGNPPADVLYGVDNTFLSRALEEDIFQVYTSPAAAGIPASFRLDESNRAIPIDYGDVCLNYDKAFFAARNLPPPQSLEDLLHPEYAGLTVVQNPATSSPGLAFLLATLGRFGETGYLDYWQGLRANDVLVVNDWEQAYNVEFTLRGGTRPIVVSYASSPPFEVLYAQTPVSEPPTGVVSAAGTCFRQIEYAGVLRGAKNPDLAEKWIDFMLSTAFQEDIPLQMYVFPVNPQAQLDDAFVKYLVSPEAPAFVEPQAIAANREKWIEAWTDLMLR